MGSALVVKSFRIDDRWDSARRDTKAGADPPVFGDTTTRTAAGHGRMNFGTVKAEFLTVGGVLSCDCRKGPDIQRPIGWEREKWGRGLC